MDGQPHCHSSQPHTATNVVVAIMMQRSSYSIHDVGNLGVHDHPLANAQKTTETGIGGWESLRHWVLAGCVMDHGDVET